MGFEKGNKFGKGRIKGSKNRITNDVRESFHQAYAYMGGFDESGKLIETGDQAFLKWARDNQTEFYRLYAKMIPHTAELGDDLHEDFVATLIFEEEEAKMIEGNAKIIDVTNEAEMGKSKQIQAINGEDLGQAPRSPVPDNAPPM